MNLRQLQYLREIARQSLNISVAADMLHISQPGVSKQIRQLEEELGVELFFRSGNRLVELTEPGLAILSTAQRILSDVENVRKIGQEFANGETGSFRIATTHTQARYMLPDVIQGFIARYPQVTLYLRQGSPKQVAQQVVAGEADIAIATEAITLFKELMILPCYEWNRCVIAPPKHPLLREKKLTLQALAHYPIITYDYAFTGHSKVNQAFEAAGLNPHFILAAIDADVIKTYVEKGLGVGIMASTAFDAKQDRNLRARDASHLFEPSTTHIGLRRGDYLRDYVYDFIQAFAPQLSRPAVEAALNQPSASVDKPGWDEQ